MRSALILTLAVCLAHGDETADLKQFIEERLREIIIPEIDFTDATLEESLDFLRRSALENDTKYPGGIGFIVFPPPESGKQDQELPAPAPDKLITLKLSSVPLSKALREIVEAAGYDYRIGESKIEIFPKTAPDDKKLKLDPELPTVDALAARLGYEKRGAGGSDRKEVTRWYSRQTAGDLATIELSVIEFASVDKARAHFKRHHDPSEAEGILKKVDGIGEQCTDANSDKHRAVQIGNFVMKAIQVGKGKDHKKIIDEVLASLNSAPADPSNEKATDPGSK